MSEAIVQQQAGQLEYAMSVENVMAQIRAIQELMKKAMRSGEHYGVIPGTSRKDKDGNELAKPSLLKPGAEKICMMFRLAPSYQVEAVTYAGGHLEYRITCTLTNIRTGDIWGQGVGSCSTMETKYRFRNQKTDTGEPIPTDYKENKGHYRAQGFVASKDDAGNWIWAKLERVEHDNPADYYNTALKIAKKRSQVDATLTATAASDFFTQDVIDNDEREATGGEAEQRNPKADVAHPKRKSEAAPPPDAPPAQESAPAQQPPTGNAVHDPRTYKERLYEALGGDVKELKRLTTFVGKDGETVNGKSKWEWVSEAGAKVAYYRLEDEQKQGAAQEQREPGQEG